MYKELLSIIAIALTFMAFYPYIRSILNNSVKPHVFSWVIWGTTTFIVFFAQLEDGAGTGAWPIGISSLITLYIAILAYRSKSDISITITDWWFLTLAISSLPFWFFTSDPLWAVIILTSVDVLGFGPSIRKAYFHPFEESLTFFSLFVVRNIMVIIALQHYSVTTIMFPAVIALACLTLIVIILYRRRIITGANC